MLRTGDCASFSIGSDGGIWGWAIIRFSSLPSAPAAPPRMPDTPPPGPRPPRPPPRDPRHARHVQQREMLPGHVAVRRPRPQRAQHKTQDRSDHPAGQPLHDQLQDEVDHDEAVGGARHFIVAISRNRSVTLMSIALAMPTTQTRKLTTISQTVRLSNPPPDCATADSMSASSCLAWRSPTTSRIPRHWRRRTPRRRA